MFDFSEFFYLACRNKDMVSTATTTSTLAFPHRALHCLRCLLDNNNSSSSLGSSIDSRATKRRNFPVLFICDVGDDEMMIMAYLWVFAMIMIRHFTSKLITLAFFQMQIILNYVVLWSFLDVGGSFVCVFSCCVWILNSSAMVFERLLSLSGDCASACLS